MTISLQLHKSWKIYRLLLQTIVHLRRLIADERITMELIALEIIRQKIIPNDHTIILMNQLLKCEFSKRLILNPPANNDQDDTRESLPANAVSASMNSDVFAILIYNKTSIEDRS